MTHSPFARPEPDRPGAHPAPAARPRRAYADPDPAPAPAPAPEEPSWTPDPDQRVRRSRPGLWVGLGVLVLVLLIGAAFALRPLLNPAPAQPAAADRAIAYLQALAAGDAEAALAMSHHHGDGPLLSAEQLRRDPPKITDITVLDAGSGEPGDTEVVLGYRLEGREVSGRFPLFQNPARQWQLRRGSVQLKVAPKPKMIPVYLDDTRLQSTGYTYLVDVFPGTHTLGTGSRWLNFETTEFTVTGISDTPELPATTVPAAAYKSVLEEKISDRLADCAKSTELAPPGCPWARKARADQPVRPGSVSYQLLQERITVPEPGEIDAIAHGSVQLSLRISSSIRVGGNYQRETEEFDVTTGFAVDLLSAGPDFVWE